MCVRPLSIRKLEFGDSVMWQNYSLNCYQLLSPVAILCFRVFILSKSAFCFKRRGHRGLNTVSRPYCFPQWPHHFTFPSTERERSSCPTSLLALVILDIFQIAVLTGAKLSLYGFVCIFLTVRGLMHIIMYLLDICTSLKKCLLSPFLFSFFNQSFGFLVIELCEFFLYFIH